MHRLKAQDICSRTSVSSPELSQRYNRAAQHLFAAEYFCKKLEALEKLHAKDKFGAHNDEISWVFYAAIMAAVACLEAFYNELIEDLNIDRNFAARWERKPIIDRFDYLLKFREAGTVSKGESPAQDVGHLIKLRNAIVHYRPEWSNDAIESEKLENRLRYHGVPSPLFHESMAFFPYRCCSVSYAEWAIDSVRKFMIEVTVTLNNPDP